MGRWTTFWLWAALLGAPCVAFAQDDDDDGPAHIEEVGELDQQTLDQAETLFFQALASYRKGAFEQAAVDFQKAFVLTGHRDLLYNIARSRERLGDKKGAIEWYRAYLATKPSDETAVIHRIKQLGGEPTPEAANRPALREKLDMEPPPAAGGPIDPWPWVALGVGVAAAGAGAYFGLAALDEAADARAAETRDEASPLRSDAESDALFADIAFATSAVAVGAAVYLFLRSDNTPSTDGQVQVGAGPDGIRVGLSGSF